MVQIALIQMYNYPIPLSKLDLSGIVLVCFMQNGQDSASESWYRVTTHAPLRPPASLLLVKGLGLGPWSRLSRPSERVLLLLVGLPCGHAYLADAMSTKKKADAMSGRNAYSVAVGSNVIRENSMYAIENLTHPL